MVAKTTEVRSNVRNQNQSEHDDFSRSTPAERLQMVWQLTLDAWALKGEPVGEFHKDIVRVIRLQRK